MVFSNFSKTFCVGTLLGLSVITPANAYDNEDVLGRFLEQNFSAQQKLQAAQPQATQARTTAEVDPLASTFHSNKAQQPFPLQNCSSKPHLQVRCSKRNLL